MSGFFIDRANRVFSKMKSSYFHFESDRETFEFAFLSGLYGIIFLFLFIRINPGNISYLLTLHEAKEVVFKTYLIGWFVFPFLGIAAASLIKKIKEKGPNNQRPFFYKFFILWNVFFAGFLLNPRESWFFHRNKFTLAFLLTQVAAIYTLKKIAGLNWSFSKIDNFVYSLITFMGIAWLLGVHWKDFTFVDWQLENYLVFILIVLALHYGIPVLKKDEVQSRTLADQSKLGITKVIFSDIFALALILFLTCDTNFRYLENHCSFYLGPLSDLLGGKSLLADVNAQYGVLSFYFLKIPFTFFPLDWVTFSALLVVLQMIQYSIFYFIVRQLFVGQIIPLFTVLILILINQFGQIEYYTYFPSSGPLRFGFAYVLMALILLRSKHPKIKNVLLYLESLVIGVAFFWSFEVCFYTVPAYLIFMFFESLKIENKIQFDTRLYLKRMLTFVACILLIGAYLNLDIFLKTHELPHWAYYFNYIFLYQSGFGMEGLHVSGYWWLIVGILYFSIFCIFSIWLQRYKKQERLPKELNAIFFLNVYGIFQFYYYLGRSNANNLFHVSMPSILLSVYWLYYLGRFNPPSVPVVFKNLGFFLVVITAAFYVQPLVWPAQVKILEQSVPIPIMFDRIKAVVKDLPKDDFYAKRVLGLMEKYSGDKKRLVYFLGDQGLNVALCGKRLKVYPYNDWEQANICAPTLNRILAFDPHLEVGDYIYYDLEEMNDHRYSWDNVPSFEGKLLSEIEKQFELKIVEKDETIVVAKVIKVRKQ